MLDGMRSRKVALTLNGERELVVVGRGDGNRVSVPRLKRERRA